MGERPLVPLALVFAGGIVFGHKCLSPSQGLILPVFLSVAVFLLAVPLLSRTPGIICLLIAFFLTGALLDMVRHQPSRLLPYALRREKAVIEGTLLEPVRIMDHTGKFTLTAHLLIINGMSLPLRNEKIAVTLYSHVPVLGPGQKIRFPARLKPFKNFNNPGRYDYESAMKLKGFTCAAAISDGRYIVVMGKSLLPLSLELLKRIQTPVRTFFTQTLGPEAAALYRAIVLGERQAVSRELREAFNRTGLGHVLAVSGLHVGLVVWAVFFFFRWMLTRSYVMPLRIDVTKAAAVMSCFPVLGYIFLAGFQISAQRAMFMVLAFLLSLILGRRKEVWSTLALAGLLILAIDPHAVFSMSFQLSFSAVIGILWLSPPLMKILSPAIGAKEKSGSAVVRTYLAGLVAVCVAATIFLLPLVLFFFHRFSIISIAANLMVVPVLGMWVLPLALVSVLLLPLSTFIAAGVLHASAWGLDLMINIIRFWSGPDRAAIWTVTPNIPEILLYYAFLFFVYSCRHRTWAKAGVIGVAILFLADAGYWINRVKFNRELIVTFIDVGQANAALVEFPGGKKMMIDGGGFSRDYFDVGRMVLAPFLWHEKILKIDYLVLTHPQSDHMNGLRFIAKTFHPEEFWYNGDQVKTPSFVELMHILKDKNVRKRIPDLQEERRINGVKIEVLHPGPGKRVLSQYDRKAGLNNRSLVLKISYAGASFLFPGDLEQKGEKVLISHAGRSLRSDVLLCPHHGSRNSSSGPFLKRVKPAVCVISSGEGNRFGFPHRETLERLRKTGCTIIRTDRAGAIRFTVAPDEFHMTTFLSNQCPDS